MSSSKIIEKGDLILITGGTGWVGSHIVEKAIENGLRVRMAIRDEEKANRFIKGLKQKYGDQIHLEFIKIEDMSIEGCFDEAIKGIQAIVHSASNVSFSHNWKEVIPSSLKGCENLLKAANKQGSTIKRVVITSSSVALGQANISPEAPIQHWTSTTWNEQALQDDKRKDELNAMEIYAVSKTLMEKNAWRFMEENKPDFILNCILPGAVFGGKTIGSNYLSTGMFPRLACMEKDDFITTVMTSQYFIDVDDVGLLHILALTQKDIQMERIIAFTEIFTWNQIIDLGKKYLPSNKFNPSIKTEFTASKDITTIDNQRIKEILQPFGGLKSLEHSIKLNLQD